jgi:hypothetical protein
LLSSLSKAHEILNMVKGENETMFSQASHKAIEKQTQQDSYKFPPHRVPVGFQA